MYLNKILEIFLFWVSQVQYFCACAIQIIKGWRSIFGIDFFPFKSVLKERIQSSLQLADRTNNLQ